MTDNHCCSAEELHDYVRGRLSDAAARRVERHSAECSACREALVREAREEVAMFEIAEHASRLARGRELREASLRRAASIGIASIAVAAAALLAFASEPAASSTAVEPRPTHAGPTFVRALSGALTTDGAPCADDGRGCVADASWRPE
ncbi:MAG: zf-HC2 domain-containing protein [Myxococcales bacterium]|nr:zf-HC2 domain-containing protein [Myxococcales bacterium]